MSDQEQIAQLLGMGLAAITAGWVAADARRRGFKNHVALAWGAGVLLVLIIFLPLYLFLRKRDFVAGKMVSTQTQVSAPCPYCGYLNKVGANYCEKCNRQLKSSSEIHSR